MEINEQKEIFKKIKLDSHRQVLRAALMEKAAAQKRSGLIVKLIPALAAALVMAATGLYMAIDNNNTDGKVNSLGGVWCTYNDNWQGGTSTIWPPASINGENSFVKSAPGFGDKGYAVRITGTTGGKLGRNYAGVNTFLSEHSTCPECFGIDITNFKGVKFRIKGELNGGSLFFAIPHESREVDKNRGICRTLTGYADYEADISASVTPEWKEVRLNFRKDFKQPIWVKDNERVSIEAVLADAGLVKWQYKSAKASKYDIWIDDLELY
ncbi:MAG: hypothetical protein LLG37_03580 [Spirochaetia bacterium]|nr:hypothetical protein [Spirochaetia bacterium]